MNVEKVCEKLQDVIKAIKETTPTVANAESSIFKKLSDGWVLDKGLGIEWGPTSKKEMDWSDANTYAKEQGGRLPTVKELRSLVDYEKHDPCIDKDFFPDTKCSWYWTSTECNWNKAGSAWVVGFSNGGVYGNDKVYDVYVRPCRASQCLIL